MRVKPLLAPAGLFILLQLTGCAVVSLLESPQPPQKPQTQRPADKPVMSTPALPPQAQPTVQPPAEPPPPTADSPSKPLPAEPVPPAKPEPAPTPPSPTPSPTPPTHPAPVPEPPAEKPPAKPQAVKPPSLPDAKEPVSGFPSLATDPKDYRQDAARHLYNQYSHRVYKGQLPPMLKAVCVVDVVVGPKGQVLNINWVRAPRHADVTQEIESLILAAGPFPTPVKLRKVVYTETWLWHASGRFQLDTLTEGQK